MPYKPERRPQSASEQKEGSLLNLKVAPDDARAEFKRAIRDGMSEQEAADYAADKIAQKFVDYELSPNQVELFKKDIGWQDAENPGNYTLIYSALRNRLSDDINAAQEMKRTSQSEITEPEESLLAVDFSDAPAGDQRIRSAAPESDKEFETLDISPEPPAQKEQPARPKVSYYEDQGINPTIEAEIPAAPQEDSLQLTEQEEEFLSEQERGYEEGQEILQGYVQEVAEIMADPANRELAPAQAISLVMQRHENLANMPRNVSDVLSSETGHSMKPRAAASLRELFTEYALRELNLEANQQEEPPQSPEVPAPEQPAKQPSARELFNEPVQELPPEADKRSADEKRLDELVQHFSGQFPDKVTQKQLEAYLDTLPLDVIDTPMEVTLKDQLAEGIEDRQERGAIRRIDNKKELLRRYLTQKHGNITKGGLFGKFFGR